MRPIDYHVLKRPLTGREDECGDTGLVKVYDGLCLIALVDALGHGKEAHDVAVLAEEFLMDHFDQDLADMLKGLHARLEGTRGAAAAVCRLDLDSGELACAGIGNISMRLFGRSPKRLVGRDGVLGYRTPAPRQSQARLGNGDIFIMSSDGIKEHFDPVDYPELFKGNAKAIAAGIMENLGKGTDDASCVAVRYGES